MQRKNIFGQEKIYKNKPGIGAIKLACQIYFLNSYKIVWIINKYRKSLVKVVVNYLCKCFRYTIVNCQLRTSQRIIDVTNTFSLVCYH